MSEEKKTVKERIEHLKMIMALAEEEYNNEKRTFYYEMDAYKQANWWLEKLLLTFEYGVLSDKHGEMKLNVGYETDDKGNEYFVIGRLKIKVTEHFADNDKSIETLLEDLARYEYRKNA